MVVVWAVRMTKGDGDGRLLGQEEEDGGGDLQCGGLRW